jgi:hypothetical protein
VRAIQVVRLKVEEFSPDYELVLPRKIGLTGPGQCGKSTVATALSIHGWAEISMGNQIKRELDGLIQGTFGFSAFTESKYEKPRIRGVMEAWGYANYERHLKWLIDNSIRLGQCVNSRVFDAPEAEQWKEIGGVIVEVQREGINSETEVARMALRRVRGDGVDITIQNNTDMRSKDFSPYCWLEQISYGIEALENSGKVQLIWE